jgi:amidase
MSLPVGFAPSGQDPTIMLPVGMQLVGGLWQEQKILDAGHAWQSANDWKKVDISSVQEQHPSVKL